jgi:hypothetical protein
MSSLFSKAILAFSLSIALPASAWGQAQAPDLTDAGAISGTDRMVIYQGSAPLNDTSVVDLVSYFGGAISISVSNLTGLGSGVPAFLATPIAGIPATWLQSGAAAANLGFAPVPNTRTITAGTGLTGGGDLSIDQTISLAAGAAVDNLGFTPPPNTRTITAGTGLTGGGALTSNLELALAAGAAAANLGFVPVPDTRTVTAGTGLAGGGDLTSNIELSLAVDAAATNLGFAPAPETRAITAGTGLTGGGDLTTDRTISLSAGAAIANLGFTPPANTLTITAGDGLTGGGDFTANRTVAVNSTVARLTGAQNLTDKTLTTPIIILPTSCAGLPSNAIYLDTGDGAVKGCTAVAALTSDDGATGLTADDGATSLTAF